MSDSPPSPLRSDKEIFFEAVDREEPRERADLLDEACGTNPSQRARVEALLAAHFQQDDFMKEAAMEPPLATPPEGPAHRIGRYKLLEKIGEGGFGEVWMAEQCEPVKRRVALKLIKPGMDSRQIVARFEAERQALAMMEHPNIARIFDADVTATGRPYFVMELVRGVKITEYCDDHQLATSERLDLFIKVCQAIQHAHQKGIIHRDIKPSNILVTSHDGVPVPKVIDFGIAKATEVELTDKTIFTLFQQFIGTPAYISPEQAEMSGLDIDTRADIYSLGVLLYEMLVGQTPFDVKEITQGGLDGMRRVIRERDPLRPSTKVNALQGEARTTTAKRRRTEVEKLARQLEGDLDWIVMKCLEKDRKRRYDTVNGLAMDIVRHLAHEPVGARPPSAAYRMQKAWQRHRGVITATAAVAAALLAGTVVSTWLAITATRAKESETRERIEAQQARSNAVLQQRLAEKERQRAEAELTRAEWLLYSSKLMLAQTDFEAGKGGLALHYLDESQPGLRGWEYRYLSARINAKQDLRGHAREVTSVAFSPDGRRAVTGSEDGTAKVWDLATGREIISLQSESGVILSVAFSPDGGRIVTGGGERGDRGKKPSEVKVWDSATGRMLREMKGHDYCVRSVAFSRDGRRIASGAGAWESAAGELVVWDAVTGEEILSVANDSGVLSVAFSPDGQGIATGDYRNVKIWDAATGSKVRALPGDGYSVRGIAISPDGQRMVTSTGSYPQGMGVARIWDTATGKELGSLEGHAAPVLGVAFSPDSSRVVTGAADFTAKVWDASTCREIFTLKGHSRSVRAVAFSPDGKRILSGSDDCRAKLWDAVKGQMIPTLTGHLDSVNAIAFSPDGERLVTASADWTAKVWETATGREILTLNPGAGDDWTVAGLRAVAFSPDGTRIVTGGQDKTAKLWDAVTGRLLRTVEHSGVVMSVAFHPDGKRIATAALVAGAASEAKVWDLGTGQELLALPYPGMLWSVVFSPDGKRIVAGGGDQTAKVWDVASGSLVFTLQGHSGAIRSMAFSRDGARILTGSDDSRAKVWDAATGRELLTLTGHTADVLSVAFSPDGQRIVTGSHDLSAKIWEASTGHELLRLPAHPTAVQCVAFSPDGQRLVTGIAGASATAKIWYAPAAR